MKLYVFELTYTTQTGNTHIPYKRFVVATDARSAIDTAQISKESHVISVERGHPITAIQQEHVVDPNGAWLAVGWTANGPRASVHPSRESATTALREDVDPYVQADEPVPFANDWCVARITDAGPTIWNEKKVA